MFQVSRLLACVVVAGLAAPALTSKCVTYGVCARDKSNDKDLSCASETDPALMDRSALLKGCPALAQGDSKKVPACCDMSQLNTLNKGLQKISDLGVSGNNACYRNFQNLICQSVCSPMQSEFFAVNASSTASGSSKKHVVEAVYAVDRKFAEGVFNSCKNTRTWVLGMSLTTLMCGPKCTLRQFFTFLGSTPAEGGESPMKTHYVISETPVTVNGKQLTPLDRPLH